MVGGGGVAGVRFAHLNGAAVGQLLSCFLSFRSDASRPPRRLARWRRRHRSPVAARTRPPPKWRNGTGCSRAPPPPARPTAVPGRPGLWLKHAATAGRHAAESRPPPGPSPSGRAPAGRGPPRGWCTPLCMDRGRVGGRPRVENSEGKGRAESDGRLPPPHHGVGRTAAWQGRVGGPCCTLQVQRGALHARLCGGASHSCCGASARFARLTG